MHEINVMLTVGNNFLNSWSESAHCWVDSRMSTAEANRLAEGTSGASFRVYSSTGSDGSWPEGNTPQLGSKEHLVLSRRTASLGAPR